MQPVIRDLVERFDQGTLSRRYLIQGLTALAVDGGTAQAEAQSMTPFTSTGIAHIGIQVTDLAPSIEFYQSIFGLSTLDQDKPNKIVRLGGDRVVVSLHEKSPAGIVDHFAISIVNFEREAVTQALAEHGLKAEQNLDYGFFVRDPQGVPVQMVGGW